MSLTVTAKIGHVIAEFDLTDAGERLGEMSAEKTGEQVWTIRHTQVSDKLKGQGAGRKLLDAAVAWARENNLKLAATCTYAKAQFEKHHATFADVLADSAQRA